MAWFRAALWICLLATVFWRCSSSPSSFSSSLSLTRIIRSHVQQLLLRYKEEQLGDVHFDDKRIVLNTLPSVTINYRTWLKMEDAERLYRASRDLQLFWSHLESQRQKLQGSSEQVGVMRKRNKRGRPLLTLSQSILGIQLDLRDLIRQVNSQLNTVNTLKKKVYTSTPPTPSTTSASPPSSSLTSTSPPGSPRSVLGLILSSVSAPQPKQDDPTPTTVRQRSETSQWVSVMEGYVILRDLERYLCRLVRDYTLLRAKS